MCFPHFTISAVEFSLMSPQEIVRRSVIEEVEGIVSPLVSEGGQPKWGGLNDPRQGPTLKGTNCATCLCGPSDCPGHFGHIMLNKPVFHVSFFAKTIKVLRCVCFYCSKLLIKATDERMVRLLAHTRDRPELRLEGLCKLCDSEHVCGGSGRKEQDSNFCGRSQPIYKRAGLQLYIEWRHITEDGQEEVHEMTAASTAAILEKISDEDVRLLGMSPEKSRPEWMILSVLPVPPLSVRPAVVVGANARSQDDLTHGYAAIINANNDLQTALKRESPTRVIMGKWNVLQINVSAVFENETPGVPQVCVQSSRPLKSLKERLKGKEGRIRGNLMGKRVDFSARSVITPDPYLSIDEVGVPKSIAKTLTFPEIVTPLNKNRLQIAVEAGSNIYPGANYVWKGDDCMDLGRGLPSKLKLQFGDKVERHLLDGDPVVFNRQPTLHKMSMMGHRVKVMPYSTFRINLSCTTPYNADFDGDEMNLHVPQSLETIAEVQHLLMTPKQLITPQTNKPVMGIVQDTLTGVFKMTRRDVFITRNDMMDYLMYISNWKGVMPMPCIVKPVQLYTGKQLFSAAIPGKLNMMRTTSNHPDDEDSGPYQWISPGDTKVIVEDSELLAGILCKRTLGTSAGSLLHICTLEMGSEVSACFHNDIQMVVGQWLETEGHSIGIEDCIADYETYAGIRQTIEQATADVNKVIALAHSGKLQASPGNSLKQTFENTVNRILNQARDKTGACAKRSLKEHNSLKTMVVSGSKGSNINISQIIACVGQQNVEGKRIPFGYTGRTLPHFQVDDHGPASRGFIVNSYLSGLTPSEFYFHAMGGREGLIDTACKTAETGYIQRRLIKAMESIMVRYDGTVRNSSDQLLEISYGNDGLCGESLEFQNLPTLKISDEAFKNRFLFDMTDDMHLRSFLNRDVIRELYLCADAIDEIEKEFEQLTEDRMKLRQIFTTGDSTVVLPCNIARLFWNAKKAFRLGSRHKKLSDLSPVQIIKQVRALVGRCVIVPGRDEISTQANDSATFIFCCMIRSMLCSKIILEEQHMSAEAFEWLLGEIEQRFQLAKVDAGEMVGALAAQSIGEPATQMTLNTFHFAGVSAKNVTLGVPRLKEIINVASCPKAPSLVIFLKGEAALSAAQAQIVACRLEYATLGNVTANSGIFYDPDLKTTVIPEDQEMVDLFNELPDADTPMLSSWVLRMEMDHRQLVEKKITMETIAEKIYKSFGEDVRCIFSDDNATGQVLRIRIVKGRNSQDSRLMGRDMALLREEELLRKVEDILVSEIELSGIKTIKKVYLHFPQHEDKKKRFYITETGEFRSVAEWLLETDGTALKEVLADDSVDQRRTYSNDICEILRVLGVEAARAAVERELNSVLQFYGLYVNSRHVSLLCDVMTAKGQLMAITRHGINRQDTSVLMRSSFEEALDNFTTAACHNQIDHLTGVSENLMLGKIPNLGTGAFDIALDLDALEDAVTAMRPATEDITTLEGSISLHCGQVLQSPCKRSMATPPAMPASPTLSTPVWESFSPCSTFRTTAKFSISDIYTPGTPRYAPSSPGFNLSTPITAYAEPSPSPSYSAVKSYSPTCSILYSPSSPCTWNTSGPSTSFEYRGLKVVPEHLKGRQASLATKSASPATSFEYRAIKHVPEHLKHPQPSPTFSNAMMSPSLSNALLSPSPAYLSKSPSYPIYIPSNVPSSVYKASLSSFSSPSPAYDRSFHTPSPASYSASPGFSTKSRYTIVTAKQSSESLYSPTSPTYESNNSTEHTQPSTSKSSLLEYSPGKPTAVPIYTPYHSEYSSNQATSPLMYSPSKSQMFPALPSYQSNSVPEYSPHQVTRTPGYSTSYSDKSPAYSPASPAYSPVSPAYSPASPAYSPASPAFSSASPAYSPASPAYSPASPAYSPASPAYSPPSPAYTPSYSKKLLEYSPSQATSSLPYSPNQLPTSPEYSPSQSPVALSYKPCYASPPSEDN